MMIVIYAKYLGKMKMTDWLNVPDDISKYHGFLYIIINLIDGRKYIGKKCFWNKSRKKFTREPTKLEKDRLAKYKKNYTENHISRKKYTSYELKQKQKYDAYKSELYKKYEGNKKVVRSMIESDWRTYWGSCKKLLEDIETMGEENFGRKILRCYTNKSDLAYQELKLQMDNEVLYDNNYYNGIINVRLGGRNK